MKKPASMQIERLNEVLTKDKMENPTRFAEIVKNEIAFVVQSFMEIKKEELSISINVDKNGFFDFAIRGKATRLLKPYLSKS